MRTRKSILKNLIRTRRLILKKCFFFTGGSDSNKGKSKKWRKILQFPHISQCIHLKDKIGKLIFVIVKIYIEQKTIRNIKVEFYQ